MKNTKNKKTEILRNKNNVETEKNIKKNTKDMYKSKKIQSSDNKLMYA